MAINPIGSFRSGGTNLSSQGGQVTDTRRQGDTAPLRTVGEQVGQSLFHRPQPMLLEASDYPELQQMLLVLDKYRRKLAMMIGDRDEDYSLALAEDTVAAIDARGIIFLGAAFLRAHKDHLDVVVGAMAHEIGHRPKRMQALAQHDTRALNQAQLNALLLHEEIRADSFAGRGLAELGMSCEPLIAFLKRISILPHPEYLPPDQRAEVIRAGFEGRQFRTDSRRKLFPEFDRHTSPRLHLGEY
jgi:hypothetical protein